MKRLATSVRQRLGPLLDQGVVDLSLRLTLLALLLHGSTTATLDTLLLLLGGLGLVAPQLIRNRLLWFLVAAVMWWLHAQQLLWIDNHKYLLCYWVLACALALGGTEPGPLLAWNARWLVGLTFLLACCWKVLGDEYLDGSFFRYTLVADDRLALLAIWLGGIEPHQLAMVAEYESELRDNPSEGAGMPLPGGARLEALALVLSYYTVAIEAAIAALFLLPVGRWLRGLGHLLLLAFILSTYTLVPVFGFGYVLAIMGMAQADEDQWRLRALYLGSLALLELSRLW